MKRTIVEYHSLQEETLSLRKYLGIYLLGLLVLSFLLLLPIEEILPIELVKKDSGIYGTYLTQEQLELLPEKGTIYLSKSKVHYTVETIENVPIAYGNIVYYLVEIRVYQRKEYPLISGKIILSKSTILEKLFTIWREEET